MSERIEAPATLKRLLNACHHLSDEEWAKLMIRALSEAETMALMTYAVRLPQPTNH